LKSSPFHVRFGKLKVYHNFIKYKVLKAHDNEVKLTVNGVDL